MSGQKSEMRYSRKLLQSLILTGLLLTFGCQNSAYMPYRTLNAAERDAVTEGVLRYLCYPNLHSQLSSGNEERIPIRDLIPIQAPIFCLRTIDNFSEETEVLSSDLIDRMGRIAILLTSGESAHWESLIRKKETNETGAVIFIVHMWKTGPRKAEVFFCLTPEEYVVHWELRCHLTLSGRQWLVTAIDVTASPEPTQESETQALNK